MSSPAPSFAGAYASFVGVALVTAAGIAGLGYFPAVRLWEGDVVPALLAGCGISWVASSIGAIPVALALAARSRGTAMAILAATVIRFLTALLLVAPLALSGWFDRTVLVVCVGVSYVLMLLVDTLYSIRMMRRLFENE
ncbi:MAG: hypothetical protein ACYTFA_14015 [Planctomycetota bacterium]|jgi:hypothetical protein